MTGVVFLRMKTVSITAPDLRSCNAAGFGVFFALSFLAGFSRFLFLPFRNEFSSFFLIAAFLLLAAIGSSFLPRRKSSFRFHEFLLFALLANVICLFLLRRHVEPVYFAAFFFLIGGRIAGYLRRQVFSGATFTASCLGGAAAGMLVCALAVPHCSGEQLRCPAAALVLLVFLIQIILISKQKTAVSLKILLILAWLLLQIQFYLLYEPAAPDSGERLKFSSAELKPALVVQSLLQPNRNNLKVMFIGDSVQVIRQLSDVQLVRKLVAVPLKDGTGLYHKLNSESEDFDLILIQMPLPDSLYGERFYSVKFSQILKDRLQPDGVLAVWLPEEMLLCRKNHLRELYGTTGVIFSQVFPNVKPADDEPLFLLCGSNNLTVDPEELNRRAMELLADSKSIPRNAFLMNTRDERIDLERDFRVCMRHSGGLDGIGDRLLRNNIRRLPGIDWALQGGLWDQLQGILIYFLAGLTILILLIRYFISGGPDIKQIFLSWENGFYTGLTILLFLLPFQQHSGRLYRDWMLLGVILLLSALAGTCLGRLHRSMPLLLKLLPGLSLLLPLCGFAFLNGYAPETPVFYAITAFIGITSGLIGRIIRAELAPTIAGVSAGLLLGLILVWLPYGIIPAVILAILVRIPPASPEKLQKIFDKPVKKG